MSQRDWLNKQLDQAREEVSSWPSSKQETMRSAAEAVAARHSEQEPIYSSEVASQLIRIKNAI